MVGKRKNRNFFFLNPTIWILIAILVITLHICITSQNFQSETTSSQLPSHPEIARMPVTNNPPTALVIPSEARIQVGENLILSGEQSNDSDGEIVQFLWSFSPGSSISRSQITVQFSTQGTRNVVLTVIDDCGEVDSAVATIEVIESPTQPMLFISAGLDNIREINSGTEVVVELQLVAYNRQVTGLRATVLDDSGLNVQVFQIPDKASPSESISFKLRIQVPENLEGPFGATIQIQVQGDQTVSNIERIEVIVPAQPSNPDLLREFLETMIIIVVAITFYVYIKWGRRG